MQVEWGRGSREDDSVGVDKGLPQFGGACSF